ncbi:hypothetical protein G7Z17_g3081 [Cylindrodendrum hubeiense]|uniref:Uncharacterized protein n=1 Tax=Cylindrodendrum hubeiense TaxID=595255 RepID=A0A9P5LII2_9HYPO|nr:hypothetical protein G7Z17_g3081 [Cylindrodendrum hubeiense]
MGMQGPLTAQALGRSPYDDVVEWDRETEGTRESTQQFDHRGRPVNPETKRINRDIVRSHNEVMLVIGVAEQENPNIGPEAASQRRHEFHEDAIGIKIASSAHRCIEAVGIFGLHGARQRILVRPTRPKKRAVHRPSNRTKIYKRYSQIPFWDLYQATRKDFSFLRDVLPGAPASLLSKYAERYVITLWNGRTDRIIARRCVHEVWSYLRVHLELYVALQRLGLISSNQWFPALSYFVPFTEASPIPAPPPLRDFTLQSLLQWVGGLAISATPFLVWVMTQRMVRDWKPKIWNEILSRLPNTGFSGRRIPPPPPLPSSWRPTNDSSRRRRSEPHQIRETGDDVSPLRAVDGQLPDTPVEAVRRQSTFSARGDDYASDEEEMEGVSATLISFDVEASESTEAPAGLWSAELRPSVASDANPAANSQPLYLDTMLTRLSPLMASHIFTDAVTRILMSPYEATALRLLARTYCLRQGIPCDDICNVNLLSGLNMTAIINFLCIEFVHLSISGEVWAAFTGLSQFFHKTEEEWKQAEADKALGWSDD